MKKWLQEMLDLIATCPRCETCQHQAKRIAELTEIEEKIYTAIAKEEAEGKQRLELLLRDRSIE